jgi:hypothetical protein
MGIYKLTTKYVDEYCYCDKYYSKLEPAIEDFNWFMEETEILDMARIDLVEPDSRGELIPVCMIKQFDRREEEDQE